VTATEWVKLAITDQAAFLAAPLPLPEEALSALQSGVLLIIEECAKADEACREVAALAAAVRSTPAEPPDLLGLSRLGELLPLLVARTLRDGAVPDELFTQATAQLFEQAAARRRYLDVVEPALRLARRLQEQGRPLRPALPTWDPALVLVAAVAHDWPLWTRSPEDQARAQAASAEVARVGRLVDAGTAASLFGEASERPAGAPRRLPPRAPPPPPPRAPGAMTRVSVPGLSFEIDPQWKQLGHWDWEIGQGCSLVVEMAGFEIKAPAASQAYDLFLANKPHLGPPRHQPFTHPLGYPADQLDLLDLGMPLNHRYIILQGERRLVVCRIATPTAVPPRATELLEQVARSVRLTA
jgi:hypothetical protein